MKLNKLLCHVGDKEERLPTFFEDLDWLTGGLIVGGISTIAGRPAMGKTAFAMSVVRNMGILNRIPTAVLSLADDAEYVAKRLMATQFGWDAVKRNDMQPTRLTAEQKEKIAMLQRMGFEARETSNAEFLESAKSAPVWIEHAPHMTMSEVVSRMERLKQENDIRLLVIDSFGWIAPCSVSDDAMHSLASAAEMLKIAVLMVCDLTRAVEYRGGLKKPQLSDLRDGTLVEQYSSLVMFIYRPEYYCVYEDNLGSTENMAYIIVARNRRGNTGEVRLRFVDHARFDSLPHGLSFPPSPGGTVMPSGMNCDF